MVEVINLSEREMRSERQAGSSAVSRQASDLLAQHHSTKQTERIESKDAKAVQFSNIYEDTGSSCKADGGGCSWRPGSVSSPSSREWAKQQESQRQKPVELEDGKYEVRRGDTLNDIAKRILGQDGHKPNPRDVADFVKSITDANKGKYDILDCNPDLIRPGMKLVIPGRESEPQGNGDTKGGRVVPGGAANMREHEGNSTDATRPKDGRAVPGGAMSIEPPTANTTDGSAARGRVLPGLMNIEPPSGITNIEKPHSIGNIRPLPNELPGACLDPSVEMPVLRGGRDWNSAMPILRPTGKDIAVPMPEIKCKELPLLPEIIFV